MTGCQKIPKKINKDSHSYTRDKRNKVLACGICTLECGESNERQMVYLNPSYARTDFNVNKVKDNVGPICPCKT